MAEISLGGVIKEYVPYELRQNEEATEEYDTHPLDSEESKAKERMLKEWWNEARTAHSDNRYEQAVDADFYDGLQWRDEDAEELRERGQAPLVFNQIQQHIRWILGTERRTRVQYKVHGRTKEDSKPAQTKTKLLKYTDDTNKAHYTRSKGFEDAVKVGVGWLECGIRSDPTDEPLFDRWESWRNMWNDPLAKEPDNSDARFLFRAKWIDEDIALAMFPDRHDAIKESAVSHQLFGFAEDDDLGFTGLYHAHSPGSSVIQSGRSVFEDQFDVGIRRRRVRLIEAWYRVPETVSLVRTRVSPLHAPIFANQLMRINGREVNKNNVPGALQRLVDDGHAAIYDAVKMKVWVAIFCNKGLLQDTPSPYRHDKFPFTPIWGFKRDRDNMPYGVIRNMRDPQEDLNKRRSKALYILSTNRVIADEDAVEDWDELEEQVARPDGIIKKLRGSEIEIQNDTTLAREHVNLMIQDQQFLEQSSGVTEENRGEVTNAISGTAINLRQAQGSVVTADLFDNLRYALQCHGEKKLSLIEQFYSEPKQIRITNDRGTADYMNINMPRQAENGEGLEVENDITRSQADFIVDTADFRETVRIAMFESLMNLMGQLDPEVQMQLLDLVIEMSDVPNRDEMVRRIREINGQVDPDSENVEAERKARADAKAEEAELAKREREAEIGTKESRTTKTLSDASRAESETMAKAAEIANMLAENPGMAAAIDELFASFKEVDDANQPQAPTGLPQPAQPAQQMEAEPPPLASQE
jgi:hypothetical protein